jgi:hypothetical protein
MFKIRVGQRQLKAGGLWKSSLYKDETQLDPGSIRTGEVVALLNGSLRVVALLKIARSDEMFVIASERTCDMQLP